MENEVLERIKDYAIRELQKAYGFCGAAVGEKVAMLNSSDGNGKDLVIKFEIKSE